MSTGHIFYFTWPQRASRLNGQNAAVETDETRLHFVVNAMRPASVAAKFSKLIAAGSTQAGPLDASQVSLSPSAPSRTSTRCRPGRVHTSARCLPTIDRDTRWHTSARCSPSADRDTRSHTLTRCSPTADRDTQTSFCA